MLSNQSQPSKEDQNAKYNTLLFNARRHCIVNLISTLTNPQLIDMINKKQSSCANLLGTHQIVKAVPLPGVQFLSGLRILLIKKITFFQLLVSRFKVFLNFYIYNSFYIFP